MTPIRIAALVDERERPGITSGLEQLLECLSRAAPTDSPAIQVCFETPGTVVAVSPLPNIVVLSLLPELRVTDYDFREIMERWPGYVESALKLGAPVLVCTIFRHVGIQGRPDLRSVLVERIRRLNLMAINLSQEFGIGIVDIDRAMAHIGGRNLDSDFRLSSDLATDVAGHTLAWSLLSHGLDDVIDPELQEKARYALGGLNRVFEVLKRRQSEPERGDSTNG